MSEASKRRILILGATGFIGRRVAAAIVAAGDEPIGAVRRPELFTRMFPGAEAIACDLARDTDAATWRPRLAGIDAVVNCAGVLTDRASRAIHVEAPKALHTACEQVGVRRIVHISAISAEPAANTAYAKEKHAAEVDLQGRDLDWVILRPSLVFAEGSHGGTSTLRGIAALPRVVMLPGDGGQRFTPVHVEDLAQAVVRLLPDTAPSRLVLTPCGPETMTLKEIVLGWRSWLGLPRPAVISLPMTLVRGVGRVIDLLGGGPLSSTGVRQLEFGNAGDGKRFAEEIGFTPRSMREWLAARPSSVQDKWHARLYFLRPALRWVLGLSWIASGVLGFTAAAAGLAGSVLATFGLSAAAIPVQCATSFLDIGIGLALLARLAPGKVLCTQLVTVIGYTLVLSVANPNLWLAPLGPLVKNGAFLGLALVVAALDDDR